MKQNTLKLAILLASSSFSSLPALADTQTPLEEVIVTAELLENNVYELPNSVSVIDEQAIADRTARHLEDVLNLAPNVNFSTGASRGRFIQVRGIGERSEFQDPLINSVGVLVDGIDFTGVSTAASTLDTSQVEILRGPQGTLHGTNALAGLINVVSNKPSRDPFAKLNFAIEEFGGYELGGVVSGALSDNTQYRIAAKHYQSDGFTNNVFLGRDDTNNIDETTARLTLATQFNDRLSAQAILFLADIDNGYDAFSLDNTRDTYSDEPGEDTQESVALALSFNYKLSDTLEIDATLSGADSELRYSFDEDWSHPGICDGTPCDSELFGFDWFYVSFDDYQRDNSNSAVDLRLVNKQDQFSWVAGVYYRDQSIQLDRQYTFADADFASELDTTNAAIYGQTEWALSDHWSVSTGLRYEHRDSDYFDNTGAALNPDEDLWGGRIALEYHADSGAFYYGLISRGYSAGGFNLAEEISAEQREFDAETMINYELGVKHSLLNDRLRFQLALFYQDRDDIQSSQSIVRSQETGEIGGLCPCSFTDFTANSANGRNYGLELELDWSVNDAVTMWGTLGLLDSEFDEFLSFDHINADRDNGIPFDLSGREQAHAPNYQFVIGVAWQFAQRWNLRTYVEGKDEFFFSERHDEKSDAYELLNMELGYQAENWNIAVYGKNLTDELVKTRGFGSFGNDPRDFYEVRPFNQFGAPRVIGVKGEWTF